MTKVGEDQVETADMSVRTYVIQTEEVVRIEGLEGREGKLSTLLFP